MTMFRCWKCDAEFPLKDWGEHMHLDTPVIEPMEHGYEAFRAGLCDCAVCAAEAALMSGPYERRQRHPDGRYA